MPEIQKQKSMDIRNPIRRHALVCSETKTSKRKFAFLLRLKRQPKKVRFFAFGSGLAICLILIVIIAAQLFGSQIKGATFGWLQSTWTGGADPSAYPTHDDNQSNWTEYSSSDGLTVDTSLRLERTSSGE